MARTFRLSAAQEATPAAAPFAGPVDVLNYALTLEQLEAALYRVALETFDAQAFVDAGYQITVRNNLEDITQHEADHVDALTKAITDLGGTPVAASYLFSFTDLTAFLQTAAAIEKLGVRAYGGAVQHLIEDDDLLTAALTIHGVEARHAAYLNLLTGAVPFPDAFDEPLAPEDFLSAAELFVGEGGATPAASPAA